MRKPKVENKYNLTVKDIDKFKVIDWEKLKTKCWRNNVIGAWCYVKDFGKGPYGGYENSIWVGFYDDGKIRVECDCFGGMCGYKFNKFYEKGSYENNFDLLSQEALLEFANWLLDENVCVKGDEL